MRGFPKGHKINNGRKHTKETKRKDSEAQMGNTNGFQKGSRINVGRKYLNRKSPPPQTEEMRGKHSEAISKEKHWNWQGGISFEPYSPEFNNRLKRQIRERDNYTDQLTGLYGDNVHHIDYDKKNCDPKNLITLSRSSNSKVNRNRNYWTNYFRQLETITL